MAAAERNNEEWQRLLIGKTLLEDDAETTLEAAQVKKKSACNIGLLGYMYLEY